MRSVILCEGIDDLWFLGNLIHKWSDKKWEHKPGEKNREKNQLPVQKNEKCEVYQRDSEKLAIWAVGGKPNLVEALGKIDHFNRTYPNDPQKNIVIVSDRDQDDIPVALSSFEQKLRALGLPVNLTNNSKNTVTYTSNGERNDIYIYPIIIPFNENGALETVLLTAISGDSEEDAYVVGQAKEYVSTVYESEIRKKYLLHLREKLKAEFSSVISIVNPTRSTAKLDELLMSHNWEENEHIKEQFKLLREIFIP